MDVLVETIEALQNDEGSMLAGRQTGGCRDDRLNGFLHFLAGIFIRNPEKCPGSSDAFKSSTDFRCKYDRDGKNHGG